MDGSTTTAIFQNLLVKRLRMKISRIIWNNFSLWRRVTERHREIIFLIKRELELVDMRVFCIDIIINSTYQTI